LECKFFDFDPIGALSGHWRQIAGGNFGTFERGSFFGISENHNRSEEPF
jgi:hypothetical protein